MVECAVVLAIKRLSDRHFRHQQQEVTNFKQVEFKARGNGKYKRNGNDNLEVAPNHISRIMARNQISANATLSSHRTHRTTAEDKTSCIVNLDNHRIDKQFTWMHFIPSPNTIDMMALILFPTSYIAFAVFYFKLIL